MSNGEAAALKTRKVHFTCRGEDLTRLVRDFVLSEDPDQAERLVVAASPDLPMRCVHGVCAGTMRFAGNESRMTVEPDSEHRAGTNGYLEMIGYIYAGRVRMNRRWWRPRAWVSDVGRMDGRHALKVLGDDMDDVSRELEEAIAEGRDLWSVKPGDGGNRILRDLYAARLSFYCRNGERVLPVGRALVKRSDGKDAQPGWALFEPVDGPPAWWPKVADPEAALVQFLASGHRLDVESHNDRYPVEEVKEAEAAEGTRKLTRELPFSREPDEDRKTRMAQMEAEEEARYKAFLADCLRIGVEVRALAKGDTFLLETEDGRSWAVPRAPFEHWALRRTVLSHLAAPWKPVAYSGMKLPFDDEWHTDWILGAGMDLSKAYDDAAIRLAAGQEASRLQERLAGWKATVVVDAGEVHGVVGQDILVLPDMRPEHVEAMLRTRAVIAEVGGAAVHLAQVGAEHNKTIMIVPDATTRYLKGMTVTLVPAEGRIDCSAHQRIKKDES